MSQHGRDGAAGTGDRHAAVAPASGRRRAWQAGWALLAVTVGFAAWSGWWYWQAGHGGAVAAGRLRDQVLQAATQEIADLNTVNDKRIAASEARWLADTTGAEYDQVQRTDAAARAQIEKVGTSARGTVTGAAVARLSPQAGTAQVIAVVRVQLTAGSGGVSTVSNRYVAELTRTGAGWKVSLLTPG